MVEFRGRGWRRGLPGCLALALLVAGAGVSPARAEPAGDAASARQAVEQSSAELEAMKDTATPDALAEARARRSGLVMAWRRAADAWAAAEPGRAEARASVQASEAAMERFYVPGGGLAPGARGERNGP